MSYHSVSAWLFGKLPAHGDFVARGLSVQARDMLDRWLSEEMAQALAQYGDGLADRFDAAPPLLFAHSGEAGWEGGTLCPSIDSAGRRYPLLVGRKVEAEHDAAPAARACVEAVYHGYANGLTADALWEIAAAAELQPPLDEPARGWWIDGAQTTEAIYGDPWPAGLLNRILELAHA